MRAASTGYGGCTSGSTAHPRDATSKVCGGAAMTSMTRPDRPSLGAFVAVCALLFAGSAAVTIAWGGSMAEMDGMPMPGGWAMSMTWMRMPAQTWLDAAASFVAMWMIMMVAMML